MNRITQIARLTVLSTAVALAACGGGADPDPTGSPGDPVASDSKTPPCPQPDVNGQCPTPPTGGGTPPKTPPPPPPPTTPPTTPPPVVTSDPCLIPTPGFVGTYINSAQPDMNVRIVTTGSALAPVQTTTITGGYGITTESTNHLQVTLTASGGPKLTWRDVRTEITAPGVYSLQEFSANQALTLPMLPGDSQTTGGAISGTHNMVTAGQSCAGTVSGSQVVTYTYAGIDPVTVPAGRFSACRFSVTRVSDIKTTCDNNSGSNQGAGKATDTTALWVLDGQIIKSVGSDGSALELTSYTQ